VERGTSEPLPGQRTSAAAEAAAAAAKNVPPVEGSNYAQLFGTTVGHDVVVPKKSAQKEAGFDEYFGGSVTVAEAGNTPTVSTAAAVNQRKEFAVPTASSPSNGSRHEPSADEFFKMYGAGGGTGGGEPVFPLGSGKEESMMPTHVEHHDTPSASDFEAMYGGSRRRSEGDTSGGDGISPVIQIQEMPSATGAEAPAHPLQQVSKKDEGETPEVRISAAAADSENGGNELIQKMAGVDIDSKNEANEASEVQMAAAVDSRFSQQSTVNSQQSTVNSQMAVNLRFDGGESEVDTTLGNPKGWGTGGTFVDGARGDFFVFLFFSCFPPPYFFLSL